MRAAKNSVLGAGELRGFLAEVVITPEVKNNVRKLGELHVSSREEDAEPPKIERNCE